MDFHAIYETEIRRQEFSADEAEIKAVEVLHHVANELASVKAPGRLTARLTPLLLMRHNTAGQLIH